MEATPAVSVILPVFNGAMFVEAAVESVLRQSFGNFEVLAVDDGSTDDSAERLERLAGRDARITVIRQEKGGIAAALNRGLQKARGRYMARIDADDRMRQDRLERQVWAMEADPRLALLGSAYRDIRLDGDRGTVHTPPLNDTAIRWKMLFQNALAHPSVMVRMKILRDEGLAYDPAAMAEDYALWSQIIEYGRVGNLAEALLEYRVHGEQATKIQADLVKESSERIARQNLRKLGFDFLPKEVQQLIDWQRQFPKQITTAEMELAKRMLAVLERFSRRPRVQRWAMNKIYGRWTLRMLLAAAPAGSAWKRQVLRHGRPAAIPVYLVSKALGRPG